MIHQLIRRVKYLLCLSPRFVMFCLLTSILNFSHFVCPKSPKTAKIFSKMTKYPVTVKTPKLLQLFLPLIISKTSDTQHYRLDYQIRKGNFRMEVDSSLFHCHFAFCSYSILFFYSLLLMFRTLNIL